MRSTSGRTWGRFLRNSLLYQDLDDGDDREAVFERKARGTISEHAAATVEDGPNAVEAVSVDRTTYNDTIPAVEGRSPVMVPTSPTFPATQTSSVTLDVDETYEFGEGGDDVLAVRLPVTFDDGTSETYEFVLFENEY